MKTNKLKTTVYVVMMGGSENGTLVRVFTDWVKATKYAYAEEAKHFKQGTPIPFAVCPCALY